MEKAACHHDEHLHRHEGSATEDEDDKESNFAEKSTRGSRPSTPASFASLEMPPCPPYSASDVDSQSMDASSSNASASAFTSDQSFTANTAATTQSRNDWMNWNLLTGLLVDVRDTIANRLTTNDEFVNDTDEYLLKLKNRLHNNDERRFESLHLHLHPNNPPAHERSLDDLHTACQMDKTVRHLTFRVGMYDTIEPAEEQEQLDTPHRWSQAQIQQFSQALLSLPKLEKLELCYYLQGIDRMIPVQDLINGMLFKQHPELPPSRLTCLEIHHLHLLSVQDGQQHLVGLAQSALYNNTMLQEFRLGTISSCLVQVISLDPLFEALATMPNLEQVEFIDQALNSFCLGGVTMQASTLGNFLKQAPSLKALKINEESFDWNDDAIVQLATVLKSNTTLEALELRRDIGSYLRSLGPSTLQRMGLARRGTKVTTRGYEALVDMLEQNYTLKELFIYGNGKENRRVSFLAASATNSNNDNTTTATTNEAQARNAQNAENESISQVNNTDCADQNCNGGSVGQDFVRRIMFYLKLNADGRKLLMQHDQQLEWVEAVIAHRNELDCLFHVLSSNPSILLLMLRG